jgi:hypothetical protein
MPEEGPTKFGKARKKLRDVMQYKADIYAPPLAVIGLINRPEATNSTPKPNTYTATFSYTKVLYKLSLVIHTLKAKSKDSCSFHGFQNLYFMAFWIFIMFVISK